MITVRNILFIVLLGILVLSCGTRKRAAARPLSEQPDRMETPRHTNPEFEPAIENEQKHPVPISTEQYIEFYKDIAIVEMKQYHIPASITLAQGILESGSGKGRLAVEGNNHFGIKCHDWTGRKIYHDDDRNQECFRKYKNASESFRDHSQFLAYRPRYSNLFTLDLDDYRGWAKELRRAGYATDKRYPDKLIALIERYQLYQYDVPLEKKKNKKKTFTNLATYEVMQGDTLYSIASKYHMSVEQLKQLNNLRTNTISIGQLLKVPQ